MGLTYKIEAEKIQELDEPIRNLYRQDGNEFVLDVDGVVPATEVGALQRAIDHEKRQRTEVTTRNQALEQAEANLRKDLDDAKRQLDEASKGGDEALRQRLDDMKTQHETELATVRAELSESQKVVEATEGKLKRRKIQDHMSRAAKKLKVRPEAELDVLNRAGDGWDLDEHDNPVLRDSNGEIMYSRTVDPTRPMGVEEYMQGILKDAPHLLQSSAGGGATGSGGGGSGTTYRLSRADARNPARYQEAKKEAQKLGKQIEIID